MFSVLMEIVVKAHVNVKTLIDRFTYTLNSNTQTYTLISYKHTRIRKHILTLIHKHASKYDLYALT